MRILIISYGYEKRGLSESLAAYEMVSQIKKKYDVVVLTKDKAKENNVIQLPVNSITNSWYYKFIKPDYFEFIIKAYLYAKKNIRSFDLIHHISPASLRFPNPLCNIGKPFIWGPIGGSIPYPKNFEKIEKKEPFFRRLKFLEKYRLEFDPFIINTLKNSKAILVTSVGCKNVIPQKYHFKIKIVPHFISFFKNEMFFDNDSDYIFCSGRFIPYKAIDLLVIAYSKIRSSSFPKLLITGDGPEKKKIESLITQLGMKNRIKLLGNVSKEKNLNLMKNAKFCVFPSLKEAFGLVNIEAMAMGKAIIVADNGGPSDIVDDSINGFKIEVKSISQFIGDLRIKILELNENNNLRKKMGIAAYRKIKNYYTKEAVFNQIKMIYEN